MKAEWKRIPTNALICIGWIDAENGSGWDNLPGKNEVGEVLFTYGLLLRLTKYYIHFANTVDTVNEHGCGVSKIPLKMVHSIEVILETPKLGEKIK